MKNVLRYMFLGTGNALVNEDGNFHSNLVIEHGAHRLFIDCGSDFPHALKAAGMSYKDVDHVYISHIHADHAGGLEWLAFIRLYGDAPRPHLYSTNQVWIALSSMLSASITPTAVLSKCFQYEIGATFKLGPIRCQTIRTLHIDEDPSTRLYSYGLLIKVAGKKLLFTSDTRFDPELFASYYKDADIILHDCATGPHQYKSHPHFNQLKALDTDIKKKMLLYHYGPTGRPNALIEGFAGYAVPREWYEVE